MGYQTGKFLDELNCVHFEVDEYHRRKYIYTYILVFLFLDNISCLFASHGITRGKTIKEKCRRGEGGSIHAFDIYDCICIVCW